MAFAYPGYAVPQGYEQNPDIIGRFAQGFGLTRGIADENDARSALGDYVKSLYLGKQQPGSPDLPGLDTGTRIINGDHAAAAGATNPALSAAMTAKYGGGSEDARKAMEFFIAKGYSAPQAAGIVGNLMQESGLRTAALNPGDGNDGSDSIGIAQWNGPRAEALRAYAAQNGGNTDDLMTQLGFIDHELQGPESRVREALLASTDPISATKAFVGYERPQGWTPEAPWNAHGFNNRARHAASLAGQDYAAPATQVADAGNGLPPRDVLMKLFQNPNTREFAQGLVASVQGGGAKPTDDMREYAFAASQGYQGSFADWQKSKSAGTNVTVNSGSDDFYTAADKKRGEDFVATEVAGTQAASKLAQLSRLEQLLTSAPQGAEGAWKGLLGQVGIPSEGLNDIQAAQALINSMVPDQRQPGSGTMSDADLALFKASIPQIVNQPGGNELIIQTLRGIAMYDQEIGRIATQVLDRTLTPAQGREAMAKVANPLEAFRTKGQRSADTVPEGVDPELWALMTPEERAAWQ
jgi:hypothetical protein